MGQCNLWLLWWWDTSLQLHGAWLQDWSMGRGPDSSEQLCNPPGPSCVRAATFHANMRPTPSLAWDSPKGFCRFIPDSFWRGSLAVTINLAGLSICLKHVEGPSSLEAPLKLGIVPGSAFCWTCQQSKCVGLQCLQAHWFQFKVSESGRMPFLLPGVLLF